MRISDWSSDVCSSDLPCQGRRTKTRESKSRRERLPREIQDELFPRPPAVFPVQSRAVRGWSRLQQDREPRMGTQLPRALAVRKDRETQPRRGMQRTVKMEDHRKKQKDRQRAGTDKRGANREENVR